MRFCLKNHKIKLNTLILYGNFKIVIKNTCEKLFFLQKETLSTDSANTVTIPKQYFLALPLSEPYFGGKIFLLK